MKKTWVGIILSTEYHGGVGYTTTAAVGTFSSKQEAETACAEFISDIALVWSEDCPSADVEVDSEYASMFVNEQLVVSATASVYETEYGKMKDVLNIREEDKT
jgi:hypothetical protein